MTAYCSRGLRRCPRWQADAALALLGHGFAELLHQRRVIVEKLQVPVDIRAVTKLGDREDARPVCAELGGVVWGDGEPVPEPLLLGDFLREVIAQECGLHTAELRKLRERARCYQHVMLH